MELHSRYLIGIDLGTTNTAVAYLDTREIEFAESVPPIRVFAVPQLVAAGEVRDFPSLPSFLFFAHDGDFPPGTVKLPWEDQSGGPIVGVLAREQGALVPARLVASAKSWLCLSTVDRTAAILPWGAENPEHSCSPVAASVQYLTHLRDAWNYRYAQQPETDANSTRFERQAIVLTVPASFDEEARELTVRAAREAGFDNLTLLEEPLAAFYAWISTHHSTLKRQLKDGQLVLICDVGGGTTDFSLIRVSVEGKEIRFTRTAIGEHLLLGGDNVDLALMRRVEEKLGRPRLTLRQQNALRRQCCAAKEQLLSSASLDRVALTVLGGGRSVVGSALTTDLTRAEVEEILAEGFLPLTAADDLPGREPRTGLRELGLPYASEAAITRHLAAFLTHAAAAMADEGVEDAQAHSHNGMIRPDAVLFNGGFFLPPLTRKRIIDAVANWFPSPTKKWRPKVLENSAPESAVAVGAAYYAHVRRGGGLRISGGSARGYYIGVQRPDDVGSGAAGDDRSVTAVCVLPRKTEEGTTLELTERQFSVLTNRPVSFTLYSTTGRHDAQGSIVTFGEDEMHRHAPLITVLRYGKRSRHIELDVRLTANFTEVGTLEIWCEAPRTGHRWLLQFQLRGADTPIDGDVQQPEDETAHEAPRITIAEEAVEAAKKYLRHVFGGPRDLIEGDLISPEALTGRLESAIGYRKDAWPMETIRKLCDVLAELASGRRKGRNYEARWLNLFGFCLRPGFGALLDDWRVTEARKIYLEGLTFPKDLQCQVEWMILWRRVAGGLNAGQQREIYERYKSALGIGGRKSPGRSNRQVEQEGWLLLVSLEHLPPTIRTSLGRELLSRIEEDPDNKSYLWALGRLGARVPFYGPLNCVVPAAVAGEWTTALLRSCDLTSAHATTAIVQLAALTNDPARDVDWEIRQEAAGKLAAAGVDAESISGLLTYAPPDRADAVRIFGESLPEGLRLAER